jgi:sugar lactone lactonase YvrE
MRGNYIFAVLILGALQLGALRASAQTIQTVAGGERYVNSPALQVVVANPTGVAYAPNGTVYVISGNQIEQFNPSTGLVTTVAGKQAPGYSGDGGPAASAALTDPFGIAVDNAGNLYIVDTGNSVIRKVTAATGVITTVAGNGSSGYSGDGGLATSAELNGPRGIALDGAGNLYIADAYNHVIREVTATGVISTVAGNGSFGYAGDAGAATSASLSDPFGVAVDAAGDLYIADTYNSVVREVAAANGFINTVAGNGSFGYSGDNSLATSAELNAPFGVTVDGAGNLYIADGQNSVIREVTAATGFISTVAGSGNFGYSGDSGPATSASLFYPFGITVDGAGNLYIADTENSVIRMVTAATGLIGTVVGGGNAGYVGDGGAATGADLNFPQAIAVDGGGNLYIADTDNSVIRKVSAATGVISTVAGNGSYGYAGDGGAATSAELNEPQAIAVDGGGNLYIADTNNRVIRKVAANGIISTVAGTGSYGYAGDGGAATSAELSSPYGIAVDAAGNLYIADTYNEVVRKVTVATGIISTVAGNGSGGYAGDGGPATSAELSSPEGIAVDGAGNLYIADTYNSVIRKVTAATGFISTVAGNGNFGYSGDGGPAISAELSNPDGVAVDAGGNLYIADTNNLVIRRVTPTGVISTVVGNGNYGFSGDGGAATSAELADPYGVAASSSGLFYIADTNNDVIREVTGLSLASQSITFAAIAAQASGTSLALQAGASSRLPVTYASATPGVCTVSGSTAALLTGGICKITASQVGNAYYAPATPVSQSFTVLFSDMVTLGIASGTQTYGVYNNFAIGPSYKGSPVPTGTVTLYDNNAALATLKLGSNGVAYYLANPLNVGVNAMTASYSGDARYAPESSAPVNLTVTPAPAHLTGSCWGGTPYKVAYQCLITATAGTATPPTGSISYSLDGAPGTSVALSSGSAPFTVATLPAAGAHKLTIAYAQQGNFAAATALTESFTTVQGQTQLLLAVSSYYLAAGSPITLTVKASSSQSGVPPGSVTFYDNGKTLGSAAIGGNGVATYPVAKIPKGTHTYTAKYAATANFGAATSGSAVVTAH